MSSRPYLVASQHAIPAGRASDGSANYDERTEVIADGGSYQLPVFWLSLFSDSDLRNHLFDEHRVSTLVCDRATALIHLEKRRATVLATFPGCEAHWQTWQRLIESSPAAYFKVDATEIWDLDPDIYERDLPLAVRWFTSGDDTDFATLLELGMLTCDSETEPHRFTVGGSDLIGEHLYGYRMTAPSPPGLPSASSSTPPPLPSPRLPPPLPPPTPKRWWNPFS